MLAIVKASIMGAAITLKKHAKHRVPHLHVDTDKIKTHVPNVDTDKIKDRVQDMDIDTEKVLDIGQKVAVVTGHEEIALVLTIAKEITAGDNGHAAETLIAELLSDHLTADQIEDLEKWESKLDTVIKYGKFIPGVEEKINEKLAEISNGQLNVDNVDEKLHQILANASYHHALI